MSYICKSGGNYNAIFTLNHHHQSSLCNYYFPRGIWVWENFMAPYLHAIRERTLTMLNLSYPSAFEQPYMVLFIQWTNYRGATGFFPHWSHSSTVSKIFQSIRSSEVQETAHTTVWSVGSAWVNIQMLLQSLSGLAKTSWIYKIGLGILWEQDVLQDFQYFLCWLENTMRSAWKPE